MNPFHTALFLANLLYDIEMSENDFDEYALIAWKKIGNHRVRLYHLFELPNSQNYIELPCNCEIVEAVTTNWEDWSYTSNTKVNGDIDTAFTEEYIEARKPEHDPLYVRGHFVNYQQIGNKLYFERNFGPIHILYYGTIADDEGLPELTDTEVDAIATFVAYAINYKKAIATKNSSLFQVAADLKQQWLLKCDLARVPEYINLNEMDKILDAKTSWNRKVYGRSFKPIV